MTPIPPSKRKYQYNEQIFQLAKLLINLSSIGQPYTLTQEDTVALADFRAQKKHLGQDDLTPLSRPRAHELLRRIS